MSSKGRLRGAPAARPGTETSLYQALAQAKALVAGRGEEAVARLARIRSKSLSYGAEVAGILAFIHELEQPALAPEDRMTPPTFVRNPPCCAFAAIADVAEEQARRGAPAVRSIEADDAIATAAEDADDLTPEELAEIFATLIPDERAKQIAYCRSHAKALRMCALDFGCPEDAILAARFEAEADAVEAGTQVVDPVSSQEVARARRRRSGLSAEPDVAESFAALLSGPAPEEVADGIDQAECGRMEAEDPGPGPRHRPDPASTAPIGVSPAAAMVPVAPTGTLTGRFLRARSARPAVVWAGGGR